MVLSARSFCQDPLVHSAMKLLRSFRCVWSELGQAAGPGAVCWLWPGTCGHEADGPAAVGYLQVQQILFYEDSVAAHLSKILTSDQHSVVISSAK